MIIFFYSSEVNEGSCHEGEEIRDESCAWIIINADMPRSNLHDKIIPEQEILYTKN